MTGVISFIAPSGSPASGTVMLTLTPPGNTSGHLFVGYFGIGGPQTVPFAVVIDRYQDKTFITNSSGMNLGSSPFGIRGSGQLLNNKFLTSTTVNANNQDSVLVSAVPQQSGTLLIRLVEDTMTNVRTQNAILRVVALNASSGVDNIESVYTGVKVQGFVPEEDSAWTQMAGVGALDNRLFFNDHNIADVTHDWFVALSASPETVGEKKNFAKLFVVEFL